MRGLFESPAKPARKDRKTRSERELETMKTMVIFKPTAVQKKALSLLKSGAKHILLFGGSRSGKTTVLVMAVIYRALRFAGSCHLICRYRAKDACSSVLRETLLPWLDNTIGKNGYTYLAHESMVTLFNGSEIWIGGLGDREQADKILTRQNKIRSRITDKFNIQKEFRRNLFHNDGVSRTGKAPAALELPLPFTCAFHTNGRAV
jgi:hypothetical protein